MIRDGDKVILSKLASRIRERFPEARIWAFGSRARGDAALDSDFDICIVVNDLTKEARETIDQITWEIGFDNNMVIPAIAYPSSIFDHGPIKSSPLIHSIMREGIAA